MEFATKEDAKGIVDFYSAVIDEVNVSSVRLGWNIEVYPDQKFITDAILNREMCIERFDGRIVAAAVVNHTVNPEYDEIEWEIKGPKEKIATIHALAVAPDKKGSKTSYKILADIEEYCRENGDIAIHLDVIDTNIPAYKLYTRNEYKEVDCIKMYYEVVGTREFWMLEKRIKL
ncbi:MAG: GNAT family N-acetyltransferase [Lachnospiraceae bacterium]|nr:GNAT family N-acetyltransferase [Lachnospiraceae bacterium]